MAGKVYLVGAGPGDPGLITVRGLACLRRAELVIADHLVNPALLDEAPLAAEVIVRPERRSGPYGAQEEINRLLVERGRSQLVVRLKGGDPFVFGRGGEEAEALAAANIAFEVVPGVTAAIAAPAYAGIPVTHRGLSGVVAFATGHEAEDPPRPGSRIDWDAVARGAGTLVLYMSVNRLGEVVRRLLAAGRSPDEPVAIVERGTLPGQRTLEATLGTIVARAAEAELRPPALTIVGEVVRLREKIAWFDRRPLFGRSILLLATRAGELAPGDEDDGAELVTVSPLQVVPRFSAIKQALGKLDELRAIALASVHAVDALFGALTALGRDARALAGIKLAAIGEATARRLEERGVTADLIATQGGAALAEEILGAGWSGPMLVARALAGREELSEALGRAGLAVTVIDAYETVADSAALGRAARRHRLRPFDAIGFASPKGARAFLEVLGATRLLDGTLLGAIGETTRAALVEAGLTVEVMPAHPELAALSSELRRALAARSKLK
ncbi:MAG TPA: uroporphyrinogen-III C-methyltransferase [Polyangia bacterium]